MKGKGKICIVGGGLSGMCAAIQLQKQLGINDFTIYDANEDFGGTWLVNTYPGCACDIQSHLYSLSFELNPCTDWSSNYPCQAEILEYIRNVAHKHNLYKKAEFNTQITSLKWDEKNQLWNVEMTNKSTGKSNTLQFQYIINAVGVLRKVHVPEEFNDFQGVKMHSAEWKKEDLPNLKNKRIGIIGSGASAVQIIQTLGATLDDSSEMHCYQRKPAWISPRTQFVFPEFVKWIFANIPLVMWLFRVMIFLYDEIRFLALKVPHTFMRTLGLYQSTLLMKLQLDKSKIKALTPNYDYGCKRVIVSSDYFPIFNKPNVFLHREPIVSVTKDSIALKNGQKQKLDVLILATGFAAQDFFSPMDIIGKDNTDILALWKKHGPQTYYGIVSHWTPNLFHLHGPNTGLGHNSVLFMIECQVNFVMQILREAFNSSVSQVHIKAEEEEKWVKNAYNGLKYTVWGTSECGSWYTDVQGRPTILWPKTCTSYYFETRKVDFNKFVFA